MSTRHRIKFSFTIATSLVMTLISLIARADEVMLSKDTKILFPKELIERFQGNLSQSPLATGELKDAVVISGGTKKVTKVEIINVKPISGNNPFYQLDPINNSFKDGKFYPVAVDQLASYLSGNTGGNTGGGGGTNPPSSNYATINFTATEGQAIVYFERYDNKLGSTPVSTTYNPSGYDSVSFSFDSGNDAEQKCDGVLTNIKSGEIINVNYKVPRSAVDTRNSSVTTTNSGNFDINLNSFTITGSSGAIDTSKAIMVEKQSFTSYGKAVFKYQPGTNWRFFSNLALARENSMPSSDYLAATGTSFYFYLKDQTTKNIAKITTYIVDNENGTYTVNVTMRDAGTSPCFSTTHSYCIPGATGPEGCH